MKKKSIQRIAAWLLAAGMMAGTFAQPMAVYAESTASIAASDSTTGDSITADADVVIATPTPEPDTGTDTAATPVPTADSQTPQDPASTAAPETTPAPDAAEDVPTPTPTPVAEDTADDAADTDDTTDTTTTVTPADLQSCIALLAASQLSLDADSIEPDVREETLALSDEITETEPSTLQAVVNAAVYEAPADQTVKVDVPAGNYTGTLVIPDATIVVKDASGKETNINYTNKNIILNMTGSTLTVPTDAAVGVSVFGSLTIRGGTIKAADGCTATRGVQVQLGSALTLDGTTISDFTYAGPGAGVYVKGTAAVDTNGQFDVALGDNQEPLQNADNTYQFKKLRRETGVDMDTSFTMKGGATITNCKSDGNGAALYVHNAALLTLENANFTTNNAGGFGGAVYLGTGVQTTIGKGVTFTGNHAAKDGGALYLANQYTLHVKTDNILVQVPVTFNGGTFTDNSTDTYGGALAFDPAFDGIADNTIENVTFGQAETTTSEEGDAEKETTLHGNYAALRGGAIAFNSNIKENTLKNCTFRGNTALRYAGAVYYPNNYGKTTVFNPVYTVEGCTFDRNSATYDVKNGDDAGGGAILIHVNPTDKPNTVQVASLHVKNSTFTGNTATGYGGAISTRRETGYGNARIYLNIDGSNFDSNRVTSAGNCGWRGGGAVWVSGCAWADFTANTFTGNYSAHFGGAIATNNDNVYQGRVITLGALREDGTPDPDKANTFTNNSANSWGGAISTGASGSGDNTNGIYTTVRIYGGSFAGNTTLWGSGGALYVASGNQRNDLGLEVIGTTFTENKATHSANAGAVYLDGITSSFKDCKFTANSTEQTHGGAMYIQRTKRFDMDNVTFTGNTAGAVRNDGRGGAIFINWIPSSFEATFTWNGVTFEGNTSRSYGGAVGIDTSVYLTLNATNITASNNKSISQSGGAFYLSQGHYTLTNAVFENNTASGSGGAIYVWNQYSGNSLTINGNSSFTGNTAGSSGGAVQFESNNQYRTGADGNLEYYRGELNIIGTADNPIVFSNNTAKNYSGGALCIGAHNTDKLDYLDVHNNTAQRYGGGIYINNSITEGTLTNSKIHNNTTSWAGGGVDIHNYLDYQETKVNNATVITRTGRPGDFTIRDCEITGNSTTGTDGNCIGGGGIGITSDLRRSELYKVDSGTVNIIDTVVESNTTTLAGGGIYCGYNGTNNISGGRISNNTSGTAATTANDATNKYKYGGGAVAVRNNTTTIKDGTLITGNTSGVDGGALYVKNADSRVLPASLTTEDCEIKNNTAQKGGIAYVSAGASFAMGEKTFPDSNEGVGDVFVEKNAGKVTLPAAKQLKGKYDAWLIDDATSIETAVTNDSSAEHYYTLQGAAHVVARLNGLLGSWTGTEYTTLQAALDEAATKTGTASIDLLADVGEQVTATTENNPITLNLNGYTLTGKITLTNGQNTNAFTLTDEKADKYKAGSAGGVLTGPANGIEMNNGTRSAHNTLILTGKTLTLRNLSRAVNGQDFIDIKAKDVTFTGNTDSGIRLNGSYHNIVAEGAVFTKNTGYSILTNGNYSTVALKDVEIYDNSGTNSGRVYVNSNSTVTVDGGEFHDNITTSQSGGVIASVGWTNTITINGGEFYNNKAVNGGVVYLVYTGNVTINDGKFYNNTATSNGGALAAGNRAVILTINDGEFYNNTANNGGAVYMNTDVGLSTLNMTGGEIYENTANNGGALYIATKAKVTLSAAEGAAVGGIIRDNTASQLASNLYLGGADSSLTVGEKTLLHGGTIAGDVLFGQGGTVDLANTQDLHTDGIENAKDLVWLKNDATTGETVRSETAPAQTIYTLAPAGKNTGSYAARIGSDKYFSINQAIKAMEAADAEDAETNTTTIHLLRDQTEDVTINNTKHSPTLNLNGYTLTGHITVNNLNNVDRTFTLTDDNTQADYNKAGNGGTLTAASGTLLNIKDQSNKPENTTVKLQGVTLTGATRGVNAGRNVNLVAEGSSFSDHTTVNTSGAAIRYGGVGTLEVDNCTFTNNCITSNGHAGAIFMNDASCKATITNSTFTDNQSKSNYGGAMWLAAHSITLRGNKFAGNTAGSVGGAVYLVPCTNVEKAETEAYGSYDAVLENNTFENNKAYGSGGALYIDPSAITVTTLLDHCTFTNNSTTTADGGAVYNKQGTLTLGTGNLFKENKSYNGGSGMYVGGNLLSVRDQEGVTLPESGYDTQFIKNTSGYGNYSGGWAALSVGGGATKNMRYMLFDGNVAAYGGTASAIYVGAIGSGTGERQIWIDHCSIVNNVSPAYTVYLNYAYSLGNLTRITNTEFDKNTITSASRDYAVLYANTGNNLEVSDTSFTNTQGKGCVIRVLGGGDYKNDTNYVPAYSTFDNVTIKDNTNCLYTPVYISNLNENYRDDYARYSVQASTTWSNCVLTNNASKATDNYQGGAFCVEKQLFTMHNGATVQPTIEAWFDNSSYQSYRTGTNPYDDRVVLDANTMRVSAKAAYNLSVANNPSLRHIGYFDMDTKTEITEAEYKKLLADGDHNVVYGMMVGYGMSLQLRNQDTSKGLRGIEVPSGDITFDVNMQGGLKFNGKTVYYADGGKPVAINPLLWAYKPNESGSYTGYDTSNNTAGINMNWSDEDDDDRSTHYDSKIAMNVDENHSGGTWTALNPSEDSTFTRGDGTEVKQTKLTFKVSGYTMRPISKSNDQAYSFSTGYLQVLIPLELDKYDFAQNDSYEGFLQTDMHMAGGNMTMDNVADADLNGVEAELTDKVNGYFNYTDEGILRSYAKNESTYGDNYDNSSTLGMNISRSRGGNGSYITKTNYWLGSDGKTVLNDDQNKQLGTNVTGIASKVYMTGNLAFGSEEVTPANNTDKFIYDAQVDQQAEYYYLTAYDVLMKFDPSAMRPATYMVDGVEKPVYKMSQQEVAANLKDVTHISLSDNGYSEWDTTKQLTKNYELTILYAAKAKDTPVLEDGSEGNGWQYDRWARADGAGLDNSQPLWEKQPNTRDNGGTADMDKYSFNGMKMTVGSDGATKEIKGLVYYDTLTELEKAGHTCVAVLYQIRNCCVRTGRSVEIGHMMEVTKDVSKIGRSYALTMDVRGWTTYRPFYRSATATGSNPGWTRLMDNGTVLTKRSELLYQGLIEGKGEQANAPVSHPLTSAKNSKINWDIGTPTINRITNNYQKTQYSNGYEVGGSHSGYLSGNTVLLATQNATVEIETTDVAEGNRRQTDYQLDEGQRTVTVQVTPRVTMQSNAKANLEVFDGTTQTDLTLDVKLPQDLTLQEGTLTFDYSNSSYNRGDLTWEAKYQYWDGMTWQDFDFKTNYEQNYVQRPTLLHLTTTITDVKKVLPVLSFKAGIGYPADPGRDITDERNQDGAWYKNLRIDAEIHTTYEEEDVNASLGRTDYTEIKVLRNSKTVVNKTAASNLVEIGDVLAYDLTYINEGGANSDLELCDLLPYNTEKAKTFHGAYGLKSVTVTVQNADGSAINLGTDDITVKYAGTDSVAYTNKGVLDRAATMQKAGFGTQLTNKTTQGNSVTFTPDTMPIHKATGKSELGSLYIQLKELPNAIVKVHVKLAVTQPKDGVNALLTDSGDKTVQQSNDTYNNIYFARAGGKNNALLTSPTASIKVRSRSISGLVWMDQNYDGIYTTKLDDTGKKNVGSDKTLAGITVTLVQTKPNTQAEDPVYTDGNDNSYYAVTDTLGNKVQSVTTTSDGRYTFENLKQGEYRVLFTDSKDGYMMEDDSKPVLPFGKLSVTKRDAMGDTSNKTAPQYGTEDANTLQAAMSREITLGDAVLTGRDDKTNINAGFYYIELRLAKVWQNIPDAKKAAEAKVDFTLAATQGENELEEAVYTLTNKTVSDPAKAAQDASDLTLFGKFVGTGVDFTDDSDERTVRWQTTQGLPLQAENANGPITYTLKQDTVRADGDTWIGNVSFVQQQVTEKVSSGAESDNSVIATRLVAVNTARIYEILIHKLSDVENKELEQAEFTATLQPASPLEKLLGGKVEIKSKQTIQRTGENEETEEIRYRLTDLTAGTYTLAETKAPLGYAKDPVKYKLTITDRDENGNTLPIITLEDDKGNLLYTAEMTKAAEGEELYTITVKEGETRKGSTASAVMTAGSCLETMPTTEQEQSNLPIRTQISMEITDSYLFSLPFTGGSGMNRSLLQGVAVMALAAAAFAVTAIHRKKKNHS